MWEKERENSREGKKRKLIRAMKMEKGGGNERREIREMIGNTTWLPSVGNRSCKKDISQYGAKQDKR